MKIPFICFISKIGWEKRELLWMAGAAEVIELPKIEKEFSFTKGVTDVDANIKTKQVTIKYNDEKTDADKLVKTLKDLGYTAEIESNKCCDSKDIKKCEPAVKKACSKPCTKKE